MSTPQKGHSMDPALIDLISIGLIIAYFMLTVWLSWDWFQRTSSDLNMNLPLTTDGTNLWIGFTLVYAIGVFVVAIGLTLLSAIFLDFLIGGEKDNQEAE